MLEDTSITSDPTRGKTGLISCQNNGTFRIFYPVNNTIVLDQYFISSTREEVGLLFTRIDIEFYQLEMASAPIQEKYLKNIILVASA